MKLSAILSLMRQRKRVMINKGDNAQWIKKTLREE